jgi:HK97 family phage prohead protease
VPGAETPGSWEVAGYASTFGGEPDSYGDVVARGAFSASIAKRLPKFFYQHYEPIGGCLSIEEDEKGLFGRWFIVDTTAGTDAHKLAKSGAIDSLSIGFRTLESDYNEDGVRILRKVDLFEVSLVAIPANDNAVVTSVKSLDGLPFDVLCKRVAGFLNHGAAEAKALHARRAAEKPPRDLNERHQAAIDAVLAEAEAWLTDLKALREPQPADVAAVVASLSDPPDEAKADEGLKLRLELTRRRLEREARGVPSPC